MTLKYTDVMKPDDISIAHCWLQFAGLVVPPNASASQREDMRRCFVAGFTECFKITQDVSTTLTQAEAAGVLDRLNAEALAFYEEMKRRYGL